MGEDLVTYIGSYRAHSHCAKAVDVSREYLPWRGYQKTGY